MATGVDIVWLVSAFVVGLALAGVHFAGLWWTIRRLPTAKRPALVMLASYVVRVAVTVAGFILIMGGQWPRLVACLVGFVLGRLVLTRVWGPDHTRPRGGEAA